MGRENHIADILRIVGWCSLGFVFLLGVISGAASNQALIGITYAVIGMISCAFFLGLSEIIRLIQGIYNMAMKKERSSVRKTEKDNARKEALDILPEARDEIINFYAAGQYSIPSIQKTRLKMFFVLKLMKKCSTSNLEALSQGY
jgi:hypothetical protein